MDDKKFPLGLPEGSIRAILALAVVIPIIGAAIASVFIDTEFPSETLSIAAFVLGFYFGTRTSDGNVI